MREYFTRPMAASEVVTALLLVVSLFFLVVPATRWIGLAGLVLTIGGNAVYVRRQRTRFPARVETLQEAALFPWDCETVWRIIKPAEKAPLLDPTIRRGYQVPGTPDGVGEQQAMERLDGSTFIIEVVEYVENRRAVTRQVTPPRDDVVRIVQSVEPTDAGCVYTQAIDLRIAAGQRVAPRFESVFRASVHEQFRSIRRVLTEIDMPSAGGSPPWPPRSQPQPPPPSQPPPSQ